ncbi:hypothetical protein SBRCBS47491_004765 [Sporothrix bragantina]|uniref:Uncharacterized protein n=1 Tax=Sporothrix bragantina TaxID=671064 RepID=A0ABP0BRJ6_9PEZI
MGLPSLFKGMSSVPLKATIVLMLLNAHAVLALTVLPRFAVTQVLPQHGLGVAPRATQMPSAESSFCSSAAESLATDAPTLPPDILTYEMSLFMTASGCETITPPASLSAEWSSWTSSVNSWLSVHSVDYTSYLSRCEPWQLAASCPVGTASATETATASDSSLTLSADASNTDASVTVTTATATATVDTTADQTSQARTTTPVPTLVSSGVEARPSPVWTASLAAVLMLSACVLLA